jgi:quercetin dioxygenase-like cupin family protein
LTAATVRFVHYLDIDVELMGGVMAAQTDHHQGGPEGNDGTAKKPSGRGIRLFRGADAVAIAESGAMSAPQFDPEDMDALAADGPRPKTVGLGIDDRLVFQGEGPGGNSLVRAWLGPHNVLPRHSHSGDCLYYIVEGSITMGAQHLDAGDGFFVPSNAPYAYEAGPDGAVVLEFRTQTSFDMQIPGGQLERWRKMATVAEEHGERWIELRSTATI